MIMGYIGNILGSRGREEASSGHWIFMGTSPSTDGARSELLVIMSWDSAVGMDDPGGFLHTIHVTSL